MWRFVLVRGVLWGLAMCAVVFALLLLASSRDTALQLHAALPLVPVFCIPAALFWALLGWYWNDYLFRKLGFDKDPPRQ